MNTKALIAIVVIIIIAGGVYFFVGKGGTISQSDTASTTQETAGTQGAGSAQGSSKMSLSDLVYAAKPVSCSVSITDGTNTTNGTVYIGAAMMRGDFTSNNPQTGRIDSHMIVRDNTSYVWTSASAQGFKSDASTQTTSPQSGGVNYNTPQNYSCQPWTTDMSKFDVPTTITFMSMASQ